MSAHRIKFHSRREIPSHKEVLYYVRGLVDNVGQKGLILCPGCDAPVNTGPENMETFVAAAQEFGKV